MTEGRAAARLEMVREMLRAGNIAVSDESLVDLPAIDELSDDVLVRAALSCTDEADPVTGLRRGRDGARSCRRRGKPREQRLH